MYTMSQINHIKDLSNCGYRISEISKKTGADPKTIRKYKSVMAKSIGDNNSCNSSDYKCWSFRRI